MGTQEELSLNDLLKKIQKHSITAYEISKNTGLSTVGIQKIIDGDTKKPSRKTILSVYNYVVNEYEGGNTKKINSPELQMELDLNFKNLPIGDQMNVLLQEVRYLRNKVDNQEKIINESTGRIIEFVEDYMKPVFDYIKVTSIDKKKEIK